MVERTVLKGPLGLAQLVAEQAQADRVYDAALIRPGVYVPGFGPHAGKRVRFSAAFLQAIAATGEKKRLAFDTHDAGGVHEIGIIRGVHWQPDEKGGAIRAQLLVQSIRPRFTDAIGFIEGRSRVGLTPNVSVEVLNPVVRAAETPEEQAEFDFDMIGGELDGAAVLPTGSCDEQRGCGIGLAADRSGLCAPGQQCPGASGQCPLNPAASGGSTAPQGQGETPPMDKPKDQGGAGPGGDAGTQALQQLLHQERERANTATAELKSARAELEQAKKDRTALENTIQEFEKAEVQALTEALEEVIPEGVDVKEIVGEKPTKGELRVALMAYANASERLGLQAQAPGKGKRLGLNAGAGRVTDAEGRDDNEQRASGARDHYVAVRAALGFNADTAKRLPNIFHANDQDLGLPDARSLEAKATPPGVDAEEEG